MYQHDLSESKLDERLHSTSVDAVVTVGVDINDCSVAILQKVPGLKSLTDKVVQARPFRKRSDLLSVSVYKHASTLYLLCCKSRL